MPARSMSDPTGVDYVNIGLIFLSLFFAYLFPFELFLLAYAVLGPLHYMTEIGWLHKKGYFTKEKQGYIVLIVFGVLFFLSYAIGMLKKTEYSSEFMQGLESSVWQPIVAFLPDWTSGFVLLAFLSGLAMTLIPSTRAKMVLLVSGFIAAMVLKDAGPYIMLFSMLLPTVIHVCVFTGLFMLYGALKSRSRPGLTAFGIYAACLASFFLVPIDPGPYEVADYTQRAFTESQLNDLNTSLAAVLGIEDWVLDAGVGVTIQRFIAFIYVYHYLNWFSKTKIIQWHNVSKRWMFATATVWIAAVSLYAYDYRTGFIALLLLSILHVFLEFPLNHRSIVGIGEELASRFGRRGKTA